MSSNQTHQSPGTQDILKIKLAVSSNEGGANPVHVSRWIKCRKQINGAKFWSSCILAFHSRSKKHIACFKHGFWSKPVPLSHFHLCLCWILLSWLLWSSFTKDLDQRLCAPLCSLAASFLPCSQPHLPWDLLCAPTPVRTWLALHKPGMKTPLNPPSSSQRGDRRDVSGGRPLSPGANY